MENALEIRHLNKKYTDFALEDVNITLPSGYIMGFIGENGAGKSTTIRCILELAGRDGGDISVLGGQMSKKGRQLKEHIGVVLSDTGFPDNLSASNLGTIMNHSFRTWDPQKYDRFLKKFSLPLSKPVKEYSRGMVMKLSIAMAMSHDSRLLILDEATSGLDPVVRDEILDTFLEFIQDEGHSIFISSHILSDLEKICDYITFIHKGKILLSEPKDGLTDKYVVLKCSEEEYKALDPATVVGVRRSQFGVSVLTEKRFVRQEAAADKASIEDIMLYFIKEGR